MTKWLASLLAALLLAGCGGTDERAEGVVKFAGRMHTAGGTTGSQAATTTVTAEMTLDWAEYKYPDLFPKAIGVRFPSVEYLGVVYNARAYSGSAGTRYVGITPDGRIFGLGDFTGDELQQFSDITHWAPQILADECNVRPDRCSIGDAQQYILTGLIVIEPTCGGPQLPEQTCSAPLAGAEVRLTDSEGRVVGQATTDAGGRFSLSAPAGTYFLNSGGPGKLPRCPVLPVVLPMAADRPVQIECDSGMR